MFKNRFIGKRVAIFKDIKNNRWTIWTPDLMTHLGYANEISLKSCHYCVNQKKRKRVLETGNRFPHAWIIGVVQELRKLDDGEVKYNPFKDRLFKRGRRTILHSRQAHFSNEMKVFCLER